MKKKCVKDLKMNWRKIENKMNEKLLEIPYWENINDYHELVYGEKEEENYEYYSEE